MINSNRIYSLKGYIDAFYDGNSSAFAKASNKSPQHIWRQLQQTSYFVCNNNVCQIKYSIKPVATDE
tara:strand:- start:626 stop:826 length:201 start_codon:yes stop_codon:yes gene_type:complete